jgi:hypothetical protein
VALDELNKTATLSGRNLDVGNLSETLEEGTQLILCDVTGQTSNEDGGVIRIGELIHGLRSTIVAERRRSTH